MEEILKASVIIVAAGKGSRMDRGYNKQYIILEDKPIIAHTIEVFENNNLIDEIILVVGKGEVELVKESIIKKYNFNKVTKVVEGGKERRDSVYNGLKHVDSGCYVTLVHDGARPFITSDIIEEGIAVAKDMGACITAVPVKDTIKVVDVNMNVMDTPNREELRAIQTPQFFKYDLLLKAYDKLENSDMIATDDAMLVEKLGCVVKVINGSYENIKITTPEDLILGEGILRMRKGEQ